MFSSAKMNKAYGKLNRVRTLLRSPDMFQNFIAPVKSTFTGVFVSGSRFTIAYLSINYI